MDETENNTTLIDKLTIQIEGFIDRKIKSCERPSHAPLEDLGILQNIPQQIEAWDDNDLKSHFPMIAAALKIDIEVAASIFSEMMGYAEPINLESEDFDNVMIAVDTKMETKVLAKQIEFFKDNQELLTNIGEKINQYANNLKHINGSLDSDQHIKEIRDLIQALNPDINAEQVQLESSDEATHFINNVHAAAQAIANLPKILELFE